MVIFLNRQGGNLPPSGGDITRHRKEGFFIFFSGGFQPLQPAGMAAAIGQMPVGFDTVYV